MYISIKQLVPFCISIVFDNFLSKTSLTNVMCVPCVDWRDFRLIVTFQTCDRGQRENMIFLGKRHTAERVERTL